MSSSTAPASARLLFLLDLLDLRLAQIFGSQQRLGGLHLARRFDVGQRLGLGSGDGFLALHFAVGALVQEAAHLMAVDVHKLGNLRAADVHAGVAAV